jgi:hypothetical protein
MRRLLWEVFWWFCFCGLLFGGMASFVLSSDDGALLFPQFIWINTQYPWLANLLFLWVVISGIGLIVNMHLVLNRVTKKERAFK